MNHEWGEQDAGEDGRSQSSICTANTINTQYRASNLHPSPVTEDYYGFIRTKANYYRSIPTMDKTNTETKPKAANHARSHTRRIRIMNGASHDERSYSFAWRLIET